MQCSISKINHDGKRESGEGKWVGKERKRKERREETEKNPGEDNCRQYE